MQGIRLMIRRPCGRIAGAFAIGAALLMPAAALAQAPGGGDKQPEAVQQNWGGIRTINVSDRELRKRAELLTSIMVRRLSDNSDVPWLTEHAKDLEPAFLFELARRVFPTDQAAAVEWFVRAMIRANYDVRRCIDPTARGKALADSPIAAQVGRYMRERRDVYAAAGKRALARPDLFDGTSSPWWICSQGLAATTSALKGERLREAEWLVPPAEWSAIQQSIKTAFAKMLEEVDKPLDDPIPLVTTGVVVETLPADHNYFDNYSWLDAERLIAPIRSTRTAMDSGRYTRLLLWQKGKNPTDVVPDLETGMWCAGGGVLVYEVARRVEDGQPPVTWVRFQSGPLEGPRNEFEMQLPTPRPPIPMAEPNSAIIGGGPTDSVNSQSPFDCRWEPNKRLGNSQIHIKRLLLRANDGFLVYVFRPNGGHLEYYTDDNSEPWSLPTATPWVQGARVHYYEFKSAYFIAPAPGDQQLLPEIRARGCLPVHWFWPAERRVEAECVRIDSVNDNVVRFLPSRYGMIRLVEERRTSIGRRPGGIYLNAIDGRVLKLLEDTVMDGNASPDGCKIAVRVAAKPWPQMKVLDLCASPAVAGQ